MADRTPGGMPASTEGGAYAALLRRLEDVEASLRQLQAKAAQQLPGDWRFALDDDGTVKIRRVSTGEECKLCGSSIGSCRAAYRLLVEPGPTDICVTQSLEGLEYLTEVAAVYNYDLGTCPAVRPPVPADDDPGWVLTALLPIGLVNLQECDPYPAPSGASCGIARIEIRGRLGGGLTIYQYRDPDGITVGDLGNNAYSVDGGATWGNDFTAEFSVPCVAAES